MAVQNNKATTAKATTDEVKQEEVEVKQEQVVEEKVVEAPASTPAPAKPTTRPQIDLKTVVPVRNITNGSLTYVSKKSGTEINWSEFGDVEFIDVAELQTMKASQPRFFNEPWIMIDDEEVVNHLGLRSMYDKIIADHEINTFFNRPLDEIADKLRKAPNGTRALVASKAREMVENGTLDSMRVIRVLQQELKIDLEMVQ